MRAVVAIVALAIGAGACAHSKIPNTTVDDTEENRAIMDILATYQRAMENRDAAAVLELLSPRYFEDNGNTEPTDDYDFRGLEGSLAGEFERTKKIQLDLRIDDIVVEDEKAYAFVYYTYRAETEFPSGTKWRNHSDRARLEFVQDEGRWLILSGL